jgi:NAD(P)-dependent dehydrogenase (short-subunit alcohol dehydrogenase family)
VDAKCRHVFITGCSTGIGHSAASAFAQRGYRVTATARRMESLVDLETWAAKEKLALRVSVCDVTREDSLHAAVAEAQTAFGTIQILVNNAGYGTFGPLETTPIAEARRQLEANTFGAVRLMQLVLPDMRAARWGRIINISSVAGRLVIPFAGWYSASKFALEALCDSLRLELAPFGIHTVSILPGPVKSEFLKNVVNSPVAADMPEFYKRMMRYADNRRGRRLFEIAPERVANVILRAAEARRPKPRYVLTLPARIGFIARHFFTARGWDAIMSRYYHLRKVQQTISSD